MATSHMLNDSRVVGNIYVHYMYDYRIDYSDVSAWIKMMVWLINSDQRET